MNILVIAALVVFVFAFTDFLPLKSDKQHEVCYKIAFLLTYFIFTIKYYYGADFIFYNDILENIEDPLTVLKFKSAFLGYYENGFLFLFSIFKLLHISFWWVTALISTFYFYAIYKLFKYLPDKKCLALCILVLLDYNQIFATLRQTIAVSLFILAIIAFDKKNWGRFILCSLLSFFFHKSSFIVESIILLTILFSYKKEITKTYFAISTIIFIIIAALPLQTLFNGLVGVFPLPTSVRNSILHHLIQAAKVQWVLLLYLPVYIYLSMTDIKTKDRSDHIFISCLLAAALITAFTYQLFYMLIRIRSYFLPLAIVAMIRLLNATDITVKGQKLLRQVMVVATMLFCTYSVMLMYHRQNHVPSHIYDSCTIFDLLHKSKEQIIKEQQAKAYKYWNNDNVYYLKGEKAID